MLEDQNGHVHRGMPDTPDHPRLCQLSDSAQEDPNIISPECGDNCPGVGASSTSRRVIVQITSRRILAT